MSKMVRRITAILLTLLLAISVGNQSALADSWTTYRQGNPECRVSYPQNLFRKDTRERGKPTRFSGPDKKTFFRIMEADNDEELSLRTLRARYFGADIPGKVIYQRATDKFLVLSGYRRDRIFYIRVELSSDRKTICILEITYPRQQKRVFDPLVTRMSHSFSVQ
jgi:hypothetical protein